MWLLFNLKYKKKKSFFFFTWKILNLKKIKRRNFRISNEYRIVWMSTLTYMHVMINTVIDTCVYVCVYVYTLQSVDIPGIINASIPINFFHNVLNGNSSGNV